MRLKIYRFWGILMGVCALNLSGVQAFDVVSGGGDALLTQVNNSSPNRELLTNLVLTTNTVVTSQTVTITVPTGADVGELSFSSDPVAITATSGNFTVLNLNQTASQIDFEITGSGTLVVQNIGLYGTNFGEVISEQRALTVDLGGSSSQGDFFRVDTRDFALGFGGGVQVNATHSASGSAIRVEDLVIVSNNALASEVITIRPDLGVAYSTPANGSLAFTKSVINTSFLASSDNFADGDTITINDGVAPVNFVINPTSTIDDFRVFLNASFAALSASFSDDNDLVALTATANFVISSDGAMPTLIIGPGSTPDGAIDVQNNTLTGTDLLVDLDEFADTDVVTATNESEVDTTYNVTGSSTVNDLRVFFNLLNNLTATFDDADNAIDLVANEDYTLSSDGNMPEIVLNFGEAAQLQFASVTPNFVVNNGSMTVSSVSLTADRLQFELSGNGELEIQNLQLFADNFAEKGEFFELRYLEVNALSTDFAAETLVVDTTDYGASASLSGATGGEGDIFIVGDTMSFSFAPFDFSARISKTELNLASFGGGNKADFNDNFSVVADNDDGDFQIPLTVTYANTNVKSTFNSLNVTLDNQPPSYDFTGHSLVVLPEGKTVAGINDIITLTLPVENSGDTIFMTANFSSVGGSIANLIEAPAVDTQIALEEVDIDQPDFSVSVVFKDDAGNVLPAQATNPVGIDLIRPVLVTADVLSIVGNPVPGKIGDIFEIDLPVDSAGSVGDTITYDLDLSAIGGATANFTNVNAAQSFPITPGSLNDVPFNQTLTVYDKALNPVSATSNTLQIDNAVPTFNISCGGAFQINDLGPIDTNQIADFNNDQPDGVFFQFPDKNQIGCDFDSFSIDLRQISGSPAGTVFTNQDADGTGRVIYVNQGNIDSSNLQFPMTIYDVNGNSSNFLTGTLNMDQKLATREQISDLTTILSETTPNGAVLANGKLNSLMVVTEPDIVAVSAEIDGAIRNTQLNRTSDGRWNGELTIDPGFLVFEPKFITYILTDDAGNIVRLEGDKAFYITNDTREVKGGGGGSLNFSNISKKETLQRFTPNQSKSFHDKNQAIKTKSKAQLRLESLRRRMSYPMGNPSRIIPKPESLIDQQRAAWRSRQAALAADATPKKLQSSLEKLALPKEDEDTISAARDDAGEFKLRSTLDNLKGASVPETERVNSRTVAPFHRGKYLEIKR